MARDRLRQFEFMYFVILIMNMYFKVALAKLLYKGTIMEEPKPLRLSE